jgi:hypothetical protein
MHLIGTNSDFLNAQINFTLTIVKNCASATVIAPFAIPDSTYKINQGTKTITLIPFTSSDSYCTTELTYEV